MKFNQFNGRLFNLMFVAALFCGLLLASSLDSLAQTGKIAFVNNVDNTYEIFFIDPDGTNRTRLSFNTIREVGNPDFSRDGRLVAFVLFATQDIYVMNSDGSSVRQLTFTNNNFDPAVSPDGTKVAFASDRNNNTDIYVVNIDGTNLVRATTSQFIDSRPSFSPDGTRLVFDSNRNSPIGLTNLYLVNTDGTNETRLTNFFFEFGARFSPDGSRIVYQGRTVVGQNSENEIFVMNANGSNAQQLTSNTVKDQNPSFSLDGTLIAFDRPVTVPNVGTQSQIFVINADGTNERQVTPFDQANGPSGAPRWIPAPAVQVSGRVTTPDGRGLRNAAMKIIDQNNLVRTVTTSSFGFYSFDNVATGQSYTMRISSRLYRFTPRVVQVTGNLTDVDFVGLE